MNCEGSNDEREKHMNLWEWLTGPDINKGIQECRETTGAVLIDVRNPQEYRMRHIPGSINVPLNALDSVGTVVDSKDTPIYLYCQAGTNSRRAAAMLRKMGYANVKSIGGIASWNGNVQLEKRSIQNEEGSGRGVQNQESSSGSIHNEEYCTPADLFADSGEVKISRYLIYSDDGGWNSEDIYLAADPCFHRYIKFVDKSIVHNSHGTDVDYYHDEYVITTDEVVSLLQEANPGAAGCLKRFEDSCRKAYKECGDLVRKHFPHCEAQSMLYNSDSSTIIGVKNDDGTESAVKICLMTEEDFAMTSRFRSDLEKAGGSRHIVKTEKLIRLHLKDDRNAILSDSERLSLKVLPEKEYLVLIKMPLLQPAYGRKVPYNEYVKYDKINDNKDPAFEFRSGLETAEALAFIHKLGYVHHDVRPENILADSEGNFVLGDLESVRPLDAQYDAHFQSSLQYRAPELEKRLPYGADIDVFAWGRSMVFILSMAPPQGTKPDKVRANLTDDGETLYLSQGEGSSGITVSLYQGSSYKIPLAQAAVKALSDDPAERWHDGKELAEALHECMLFSA